MKILARHLLSLAPSPFQKQMAYRTKIQLGLVIFSSLLFFVMTGCGGGGGGGGGGSGTSSTGGGSGGGVSTSSIDLSIGDVYIAGFDSGKSSISLSTSRTYELLVHSFATSGSSNSFTMSSSKLSGKDLGLSDPVDEDIAEAESLAPQDQMDSLLREEEVYYAASPWPWAPPQEYEEAYSVSVGKSATDPPPSEVDVAYSVSDQRSFIVLNSLTNTSDTVTISATAKCVNSEIAIFVDNVVLNNGSGDYTETDFATICNNFSASMPVLREKFGTYSDINNDGVVVGLITKEVNELGGSSGIVTGFFYSGDMSSTSYNSMEIVYLHARDSRGTYGLPVSNNFHKSNFEAGIFYHEVQHVINYYQHVVVKGGGSESSLLNEGLSHLAEDLAGYNLENYSRYDIYLASPHSYGLNFSSSATLAKRGAIYLLLRYLYEQSGKTNSFLNNIVKTNRVGVENIVAAYPASGSDFDDFSDFLRFWSIALAYTDRGKTGNSRFLYEPRTVHSTTGNYQGVCTICSANDNRGTILTGPAYSTYSDSASLNIAISSTRFFEFFSTPNSIDITTSTAANPGATLLRIQ